MTRERQRREGKVLGVGDGLHAFFAGIGFVIGTPSVWPLAAVPVVLLLLLFCGGVVLEGWGAWELSHRLIEPSGAWGEAGAWLLTAVASLVGVVVALLVALCLAQPLSGFALERVAKKQTEALTGRRGPEVHFFSALFNALKVALATLFLAVSLLGTLLAVGLLFPPALVVTLPLKFLVTAWLLAWDFVDYPLSLRGFGLFARLGWVGRHFGAYTAFGLMWAAVLLIPGVALLLLPMGVAGATRLVVATEGAGQRPTLDRRE